MTGTMGGLSHVCWVARQVGLASSNTCNPVGGLGHGLIPAQPAQLPCLPKYYKARWVIQGNLISKDQMPHDYHTYAPVVSASMDHLLFTLMGLFGWNIFQADTVVTFLNGLL